ncbi:putative multidrug resistance ABC transporter ATP-binding/permease protein YheH [Paenibacillus sp. CECT 9249]|uniref:ABC transporter ATP-binding protein n=1 Tax=Paenibacillus sp. CECT 9249 TaxID=2845385 RepID=UPI001E435DF2|nr:ABC transporter ATP-binding protein [Paenibacillus sp. CECT 9249]CAH0121626.1 putative multidrug resistance ABC transporter ATP-binding/permease protein YheH [Paenibacillus sp. CECT 9249]
MEERQPMEKISKNRTLRRLFAYMKPHKKELTIAFIILAFATASSVAGPKIVQIFIDDYLAPRHWDWNAIVVLAALYFGLHLVSVVLTYVQLVSFNKIALWIIQKIRMDVFGKVQSLGLSFYDRTPAGSLVSRITNDTESIKMMFVSVLSTFVQNIVMLIGIFIGMFFLDVKLAAYCLVLVPLILLLMHTYRKLSSRVFHISREKLSRINTKLNESLQGMHIIQAMRQEKRYRASFEQTTGEHYAAGLKQIKLNGLLVRPAVDLLYLLALLLVLSFFGVQSFAGPVEIGVLYAFINYLERFFEPINMMMFRLTEFQQAIVSAERVFGLIDEEELAPTGQGDERPKIVQGRIEFQDVSFSYDGKTDVLKHISFVANPGETVALVGHTGSGKSSIINLQMRFYPVHRGRILIDGVPLERYDDEELRRGIGLVLQDPFLFAGDIKHNIRLHSEDITDEEVERAARFVQADSFIRQLPGGYDEPVGERGATFSSGQRQLLSFARTMARNPKILVLDEATASVDTETEEAIQEALHEMRKGRTTIAIAHRLSTIQDADLILVLHQGEIVERGTHQQLLSQQGLYYRMYLLQQGADKEKVC